MYHDEQTGLYLPHGMIEDLTPQPRDPRVINPRTGMGTMNQRSLGSTFVPVRIERAEAEAVYQMSWAAAKMIDIPVDDMFVRGRKWTTDDESAMEAVEKAEKKLRLMSCLADAIKASRIFGTGVLIVCTKDQNDFPEPLEYDEIQEGDIVNLWVVDRWSCWVKNWQTDPSKPGYGKPYQYNVHTRIQGLPADLNVAAKGPPAGAYVIHESRMIRFDCTKAPRSG